MPQPREAQPAKEAGARMPGLRGSPAKAEGLIGRGDSRKLLSLQQHIYSCRPEQRGPLAYLAPRVAGKPASRLFERGWQECGGNQEPDRLAYCFSFHMAMSYHTAMLFHMAMLERQQSRCQARLRNPATASHTFAATSCSEALPSINRTRPGSRLASS